MHLPSKQQQFFIKMKIAANCHAMYKYVIKGRRGGKGKYGGIKWRQDWLPERRSGLSQVSVALQAVDCPFTPFPCVTYIERTN